MQWACPRAHGKGSGLLPLLCPAQKQKQSYPRAAPDRCQGAGGGGGGGGSPAGPPTLLCASPLHPEGSVQLIALSSGEITLTSSLAFY